MKLSICESCFWKWTQKALFSSFMEYKEEWATGQSDLHNQSTLQTAIIQGTRTRWWVGGERPGLWGHAGGGRKLSIKVGWGWAQTHDWHTAFLLMLKGGQVFALLLYRLWNQVQTDWCGWVTLQMPVKRWLLWPQFLPTALHSVTWWIIAFNQHTLLFSPVLQEVPGLTTQFKGHSFSVWTSIGISTIEWT